MGIFGVLTIVGCATTYRIDRVSVGMSKEQVIAAMGRPDSVAAPGNGSEYLRYTLEEHTGELAPYFVKLVNGRVAAYGRVGDFGSAQNPGVDLNVNWRDVR